MCIKVSSHYTQNETYEIGSIAYFIRGYVDPNRLSVDCQ